jgi:transposase
MMKFIKTLTEAEEITLKELFKNHTEYRYRARAHSILLSYRQFEMNKIAEIYQVDRDTVSIWIDGWERCGLVGIFDEPKSGRPPKLTKEEQEKVISYVKEEPRSIKRVVAKIEEKQGKIVSTKTVKRILKKGKHIWKRVRTSLLHKRDKQQFEIAQQEIAELRNKHKLELIDLYFYDESSFSLVPKIPYAWQKVNENIGLPSERSKSFNVLGLLSPNENFDSILIKGTVNSNVVINYFDEFAKSITKKTWIILDNSPTHKSKAFKEKIAQWEDENLYLYFLPVYSPELNLIEILWRFIKYQWLSFSAYLSIDHLEKVLMDVLANIGSKYQITFG